MKSTFILILFIFSIGLCVLAQQIPTNKQECPLTFSAFKILIDSAVNNYALYPEKAKQTIEQVKQCLQTRTEQDSTAELYHQIGIFHHDNDEKIKEALIYFEKSLTLRKRIFSADHFDLGRNFYMIASCKDKQGDYINALANAQIAYNISQKHKIGKKIKLFGLCSAMLGRSHGNCGDNENAKKYLLDAISLWKEKNNVKDLAIVENNLGIIHYKQQQYELAIQHTENATHIIDSLLKINPDDKKLYDDLGDYYINQSINFRKFKNNNNALDLAFTSLKMYNNNPEQNDEHNKRLGLAHIEIGNCYAQKREWSTAFKQYSTALTIFEKAKLLRSPYYAEAFMSMGKAAAGQNDHKGALTYYQKALKVLCRDFNDADFLQNPRINDTLAFAPMELIDVLSAKATSLDKLSRTQPKSNGGTPQYKAATNRTLRAIDSLVGSLRLSFVNDGSKYDLADKMRPMYEIGMNLAKSSNNPTDFLMWMEKSKALVLQENLKRQQAKNYAGLPTKVLEEEQQLKANVSRWGKAAQLDTTLTGRDSCHTQYLNAKEAIVKFEKTLEKNYEKYFNLKYNTTKNLDIGKIQAQLPDNMAFLEYTLGEDSLFTFIASRTQTKMYSKPLPKGFADSLDALIATQNNNTGNEMEKMRHFAPKSAYFYDFLLKQPLADIQDGKPITRLKIVPDGRLHSLPFDYLLEKPVVVDAKMERAKLPYLMQQYAVSYDPSAALSFDSLYQKTGNAPRDLTAYGLKYDRFKDSTHSKGKTIAVLERSYQEVAKAKKRFASSDIWTDSLKDVSVTQFLKESDNSKILHFSGHGDFDGNEGSLIFSHPTDNILRGSDVYGQEFKRTELMVLSACNTGAGKFQRGEGAMSFARALSYAGIPSTIMTFWSVAESQTSDIIDGFYEHLAAGDTKDVALQKAKKAYLLTGEPLPYYWSGIALMGNTDALTFKKSTNYAVWLLAGSALMGLLFFAFRQKTVRLDA